LDSESLLLTHAEIAVAVAGFSAVAAVLQRPLGAVRRTLFYGILLLSLQQILGCLVPVWLSRLDLVGATLWRTASSLYFALALLIGLLLIVPTIRRGFQAAIVINVPATVLIYSLAVAAYVLLLVNLFVVPAPGFGLYYASMLTGLIAVFIVFADVATREDDETS